MKISFDFDSTLSEDNIQLIAKSFIDKGHDVYITTSRFSSTKDNIKKWPWKKKENDTLFSIAKKLNIPICRIRFTEMKPKSDYLSDFDLHFDDDQVELELIHENTKCVCILVNEI